MSDLEKTGRGPFLVTAVRDVRVFRQIFNVLDRRVQTSAGNGCGQIGGIRRSHDEREEPPHSRDQSRGDRPTDSMHTRHIYNTKKKNYMHGILVAIPNIVMYRGIVERVTYMYKASYCKN